MGKLQETLKAGFTFRRNEFLLSAAVFVYLVVYYFLLSAIEVKESFILLLQFFFILLENYITIAVYCGLNDSITGGSFNLQGIFKKGASYFGRVLLYKGLAGLAALCMMGFAYGMIDFLKNSSFVKASVVMGITILWLAFPVLILLLTFMAPLIIIVRDISLAGGLRKSFLFAREHLSDILIFVLALVPFWIFAFFLLKVYNESNLLYRFIALYFIAMLEIITIKVFMLFYRENSE